MTYLLDLCKTMKQLTFLTLLLVVAGGRAPAGVYSYTYDSGFANGGTMLDGNASPWSDSHTLGELAGLTISGVSVRLKVSGGYNGDLYGYLSHNGVLVPLLNRVGVGSADAFGYADAGLNVTFSAAAANNVHFYQAVSGYSLADAALWQADGRAINPVTSVAGAFDAAGTIALSAFNGPDAGGDWTLVLADVSAGGGNSQVVSWGLDLETVEAVPEPVNVALGLLGVGALLRQTRRAWRRRENPPVK
jgi:hypothetical protein